MVLTLWQGTLLVLLLHLTMLTDDDCFRFPNYELATRFCIVRLRGHKYYDTWYISSYSVSCCTVLIPVSGSIMNKGC